MSNNPGDVAKIKSLEVELGKLKAEHQACGIKRRRLERELEIKNDELEYNKDAKAKAMKMYRRALEYTKQVEEELITNFDDERRNLMGIVQNLKDELASFKLKMKNPEAGSPSKRRVNDVICPSKSTKRKVFAKPTALFERKPVGENGVVCDRKRKSYGYDQFSNNDDFSGDATYHSDDSFTDASVHEQIFVKHVTGKITAYELDPDLVVYKLKYMIEDKEGIPADEQCLIYEGRQMEDGCTLAEFDFQNGSIINLVQTNNHIFLKMVNGKKIAIKFEPLLIICDLKCKIEDEEGIPVDQQRLLFHGRQLEDGRTLTACGIQKKSVIDLVIKLRGG